jgi:hypothetical protein
MGLLTQGETMTKVEALQTIKLLSALESWAMCQGNKLPDYLNEYVLEAMETLERIILEKQS